MPATEERRDGIRWPYDPGGINGGVDDGQGSPCNALHPPSGADAHDVITIGAASIPM